MRTAHLVLLLVSCTAPEGGKEGTVNRIRSGDTGPTDTATPPDTSEPEDTGLDDWVKSWCPYESPPTSFTHGMVYIARIQPVSGDFVIDHEGDVVTRELGSVDWETHTLSLEQEYIEGYTTVSSTVTGTFELQTNGDYTATFTESVTRSEGTVSSKVSEVTKAGCTWVTVSVVEETGDVQTRVRELVSDDQADYTYDVTTEDGESWTFRSYGYEMSDWSNWYSFEANEPDSEPEPDRDGTCMFTGDGMLDCEMALYQASGSWQTSTNTWYYDGSWDKVWQHHDPEFVYDPRYWGIAHGAADGSGSDEQWEIEESGSVIYCTAEWDTEGEGTITCDDGTSRPY